MDLLTVSEENVGCAVPGSLWVSEVINQTLYRLTEIRDNCFSLQTVNVTGKNC